MLNNNRDKNRVVITGIGLATPVGKDRDKSWDNIKRGVSGIFTFETNCDLGYPSSVAGQVDSIEEKLDKVLSKKDQRKTSRFIHLALVAADEAISDSGLDKSYYGDGKRFGSFVLTSVISNEAPAWISIKYSLMGPTMAIVNACSSGNDAIGQAFRAIQDGHADYMLAGGAESCLSPLTFAGFGNMRALSMWKGDPRAASRPFDKDRSGFVLSEGAGLLVLEREDLARKRGANIYAEIAGYGANSDAYHIAAIHPDGNGAVLAIENALNQANINKDQVGYINAHGTSTYMNDPSETKIVKKVFGDHVSKTSLGKSSQDRLKNKLLMNKLLMSSTKSMTGHMLGGAGGVEVAFTALAIKDKILPPTINLDNPDPECDLDYIAHNSIEREVNYALSNSFGFGGANSVILLKRY